MPSLSSTFQISPSLSSTFQASLLFSKYTKDKCSKFLDNYGLKESSRGFPLAELRASFHETPRYCDRSIIEKNEDSNGISD